MLWKNYPYRESEPKKMGYLTREPAFSIGKRTIHDAAPCGGFILCDNHCDAAAGS